MKYGACTIWGQSAARSQAMGILMSSWSWRPESLVVSTKGVFKNWPRNNLDNSNEEIFSVVQMFFHIAISLDAHILTKGGQPPSAFQCHCCAQVYLHLLQPSALMPWKSFRDWPLAKVNRKSWTLDRWWPVMISDVDWCCGIRGHRGWWERCWESIKWLWRVL